MALRDPLTFMTYPKAMPFVAGAPFFKPPPWRRSRREEGARARADRPPHSSRSRGRSSTLAGGAPTEANMPRVAILRDAWDTKSPSFRNPVGFPSCKT